MMKWCACEMSIPLYNLPSSPVIQANAVSELNRGSEELHCACDPGPEQIQWAYYIRNGLQTRFPWCEVFPKSVLKYHILQDQLTLQYFLIEALKYADNIAILFTCTASPKTIKSSLRRYSESILKNSTHKWSSWLRIRLRDSRHNFFPCITLKFASISVQKHVQHGWIQQQGWWTLPVGWWLPVCPNFPWKYHTHYIPLSLGIRSVRQLK